MKKEEKTEPEKTKETREENRKRIGKEILSYVLWMAAVVLICLLFIRYVAVRSVVEGNSMNPTLNDGDNLIVEKVSYYFHQPERFDVIVFKVKHEPNTFFVKRIIGLPGETVQIIDGYVYINGTKLEEDVYGNDVIRNAYTAANPVTLKEDEFFVMGDNRNNSNDSRSVTVGPVNREQFLGHACFRFWPLNGMKGL